MSTIIDVAKEAGVSTATVSRVLNGSPKLRGTTKKNVLDAMRRLHYRPNAVARSLVCGTNSCIGIMLPDLNMPFWAQTAHELERAAASHGYSIMVTSSPLEREDYEREYRSLGRNMSNGIITSYINGTEDFIRQSLVPTVVIANADCAPSVSSDDDLGGTLAARHLISQGCKHIIHISGELKYHRSSNERTYAFIRECEKSGIVYKLYEAPLILQKENDYSKIVDTVFSENDGFDGIFASNDIIASVCVSASLSRGFRIPEDIKIVGYDDTNISSMIFPPLTTVRQDYKLLAETAVSTLIDLMDGKRVPDKQVFPVTLIERKTT
nr:LacI family DNA-binding transcriptional regulator [Treponema socranskii]